MKREAEAVDRRALVRLGIGPPGGSSWELALAQATLRSRSMVLVGSEGCTMINGGSFASARRLGRATNFFLQHDTVAPMATVAV